MFGYAWDLYIASDEVFSFDPLSGVWRSLKPADPTVPWPEGWYQGSTVTWTEQAAIINYGGCIDLPQQSTVKNTLWVYTPSNNHFAQMGNNKKNLPYNWLGLSSVMIPSVDLCPLLLCQLLPLLVYLHLT